VRLADDRDRLGRRDVETRDERELIPVEIEGLPELVTRCAELVSSARAYRLRLARTRPAACPRTAAKLALKWSIPNTSFTAASAAVIARR